MTAPSRGYQQFEPVYHHYGPHKAGLPPLIPYFRELLRRRTFAAELSKASMRGANTTTFFGQAWLILNPLLLAGIYYLLVTIIRGRARSVGVRTPHARIVRIQHGGDLSHYRRHLGCQLRQAADQHRIPAIADAVGRGTHVVLPLPSHGAGLLRLSRDFLARRVARQHDLVPVLPQRDDRLLDGPGGVFRHTAGLLPRHLQLPALLRPTVDVPLAGAMAARGHRQPAARQCRR